MKRRKYFVVLAVFAGTFLVSCGSENNSSSTWQAVETQEVQLQSGADEGAEELTQIGPTVMIDGVLYRCRRRPVRYNGRLYHFVCQRRSVAHER